MKITDIAPLETWMELENEIYRKTGLDSNLFDTKGYRISDVKNWANRLCPEIKATDKGQSFICAPAHMNIAAQAENEKKPVIEECDAGLVKIVVPIFVDDEFIGAVGACGMLLDEGETESFLIAKTTEMDENRIETLTEDLKSLSMAEAESLVSFIQERTDRIIKEFSR
ncbi:PocR ligand-binding domain-containing protein [Thermodesulfobacteriota bacterium]